MSKRADPISWEPTFTAVKRSHFSEIFMREIRTNRWSVVRRLALTISLSVISLEILARWAAHAIGFDRPRGAMVMEALPDVPSFTFDPLSGYRLAKSPLRMLVMDPSGRIQSVGEVKGNNLGFPDNDDFYPLRRSKSVKRVAVFGDSMSAGIFLRKNWPARAQEILEEKQEVEILNFAVDGGGIMNWWSILGGILEKDEFQLDGLVIAVCCEDLSRGLFIRHDDCQGESHHIQQGRVRGLRPSDLPQTLEEARRAFFFIPDGAHDSAEIDDAIAGRATIQTNAPDSSLLSLVVMGSFLSHYRSQGMVNGSPPFSSDLMDRIQEMRSAAERLTLPLVVLHVPLLAEDGTRPHGMPVATEEFARILGAELWNGSEAFDDVGSEEMTAYYFIGDPHFNQTGSDRFAEYVANRIATWP